MTGRNKSRMCWGGVKEEGRGVLRCGGEKERVESWVLGWEARGFRDSNRRESIVKQSGRDRQLPPTLTVPFPCEMKVRRHATEEEEEEEEEENEAVEEEWRKEKGRERGITPPLPPQTTLCL